MQRLHFPGSPLFFKEIHDYLDAIEQESGGVAYTRFNDWKSKKTTFGPFLERDLFGGLVRPLAGLQFRYTSVEDYTGQTVDAKDASGNKVKAIEAPTKLFLDNQAGKIHGFDGGWDNFLKLGISFDTRDFEPDPQTGILAQVSTEISTRYLGSNFDYQRVTTSLAGFQDILPGPGHLVLAVRGVYSMQFGAVPFFNLDTFAFNERDREGLGAFETLRGFSRDRFVGDSAVLVNAELRWTITEWNFWNQNLRPMLAPFVDSGRVFDGRALKIHDWKVGHGVGLRLAWNLATVVCFDYGHSEEGDIFYMELGHLF